MSDYDWDYFFGNADPWAEDDPEPFELFTVPASLCQELSPAPPPFNWQAWQAWWLDDTLPTPPDPPQSFDFSYRRPGWPRLS